MLLWIDFKLYFYVRTHKSLFPMGMVYSVVNWFQIVFLREDSQVFACVDFLKWCCELISNCIFTWGLTRKDNKQKGTLVLWIDFKLYFYVRTHKGLSTSTLDGIVVNWFQIVFLREDSQGSVYVYVILPCCELISNCIFTWGLTSFASS